MKKTLTQNKLLAWFFAALMTVCAIFGVILAFPSNTALADDTSTQITNETFPDTSTWERKTLEEGDDLAGNVLAILNSAATYDDIYEENLLIKINHSDEEYPDEYWLVNRGTFLQFNDNSHATVLGDAKNYIDGLLTEYDAENDVLYVYFPANDFSFDVQIDGTEITYTEEFTAGSLVVTSIELYDGGAVLYEAPTEQTPGETPDDGADETPSETPDEQAGESTWNKICDFINTNTGLIVAGSAILIIGAIIIVYVALKKRM